MLLDEFATLELANELDLLLEELARLELAIELDLLDELTMLELAIELDLMLEELATLELAILLDELAILELTIELDLLLEELIALELTRELDLLLKELVVLELTTLELALDLTLEDEFTALVLEELLMFMDDLLDDVSTMTGAVELELDETGADELKLLLELEITELEIAELDSAELDTAVLLFEEAILDIWLDSELLDGVSVVCALLELAPPSSVPAAPPQADRINEKAIQQIDNLMLLNAKGRMGLLPKNSMWLL